MYKNINSVVRKNLCLGCGTCKVVCPQNAINICFDQRSGSYLAVVNEKNCIYCGLCFQTCPSMFFNDDPSLFGSYSDIYITHSNNERIHNEASSGGTVTEILLYLLNSKIIDGALIAKTKGINSYGFIAESKEEVLEGMGSKYFPIPLNNMIEEINASKYKRVAYVGLPCQVQGLRNLESVNPALIKKIPIIIGLFCSRMPNVKATKYLLRSNGFEIDNVKEIIYRRGYKAKITTKTNKIKYINYHDYWNSKFKYLIINRCLYCNDRTNELADVSIGDYSFKKSNLVFIRNKIFKFIIEDNPNLAKINVKKEYILDQLKIPAKFKKDTSKQKYYLLRLFGTRINTYENDESGKIRFSIRSLLILIIYFLSNLSIIIKESVYFNKQQ